MARSARHERGRHLTPLCVPLRALGWGYDCFALRAMSLRDDVSLFGRMWRRRPAFARKSAGVAHMRRRGRRRHTIPPFGRVSSSRRRFVGVHAPALKSGVTATTAFQASYALRAVARSTRHEKGRHLTPLCVPLRALGWGYDCFALRAMSLRDCIPLPCSDNLY